MRKIKNTNSPLSKEVRFLKGVGPKRAELLARLEVRTVYDLLFHLPRDYEDRRHGKKLREVEEGEKCVISGEILDADLHRTRSGKNMLQVFITDGTGSISLTWFHANSSWLKSFPKGKQISAFGEIQHYQGPQIIAPDYEVGVTPENSTKFGTILPVYPLTEGLSQRLMRKFTRQALQTGLRAWQARRW